MTEEKYIPEPATAALLRAVAASGLPPLHTLPPDAARQAYAQRVQMSNLPPEPVEDIRDIDIPGRDTGMLRLRIYRPRPGPVSPLLLYFHGGGFVIGSIETHDPICRYLAARSGWTVASLEYRLAPEHPYPAAVHDALDAFDWVWANAEQLGADRGRIGVAGDSAGGTLAAVVAQQARRQGRQLVHQILFYPAVDQGGDYASRTEFQDKFLLPREAIQWFARQYYGHDRPELHPDASPARAVDLAGLASAYVVTAELDPLRDEAADYASRLKAAGVEIRYRCVKGTIHGFLGAARFVSAARAELDALATLLKQGDACN